MNDVTIKGLTEDLDEGNFSNFALLQPDSAKSDSEQEGPGK